MKLTVMDRLQIVGFLPQEGNLIQQTLARDIGEKTRLTQDEMTSMKMVALEDRLNWDKNLEIPAVEVSFTKAETELLLHGLEKLDKEGKITIQMIDLCQKIKKEAG